MAHLDNSAHKITHYALLSVVVYFSFSPPTNQAPPLPQKTTFKFSTIANRKCKNNYTLFN